MKKLIMAIILSAGFACYSVELLAQAPASGRPVRTSNRQIAPPPFDISFKGGTLKELLEQIEKNTGRKLNVLCSAEALGQKIPELNMVKTDISSVLEALGKVEPLLLVEEDSSGNLTTTIRQKDEICYRFFKLKKYLEKYTLEDINSLIQASWELKKDEGKTAEKPRLRFHEETKILIVAGTKTEIDAVDSLLKELDENSQEKSLDINNN